ncbi:fructosamine kinase family protein [Niabella hibiscisoli]|uniref:fructosamine kinase family protein n=1 Tax=Niabella hibiscisoli TaxID=1825928 RepID=UPI001F0F5366|nr:fructosamine kinase family protein [Niabella hibiscisoli]MCH5719138.1 fructosamine kinase family protein [Niabella hibiscisoli]
MLSNSILKQLPFTPQNIAEIHGGDINKAFCITTGKQRFFLKVNNAVLYPDMLKREADGLDLLRNHTSLKVPGVIQTGTAGEYQFLLLEWLDEDPGSYAPYQFGQGIAGLHRVSQAQYGFKENNYIGSLPQINTLTPNWPDFYANYRILPLVKMLFDQHQLSSADIAQAHNFCGAIKDIFPEEKPALLHGDLWSGNYSAIAGGQTAIFDPAVYYGHREMDIAMTKLFGGFKDEFYTSYHEAYPLENGWLNRLPYAQLYPLLVHAVLFGGHYTNDVKSILRVF